MKLSERFSRRQAIQTFSKTLFGSAFVVGGLLGTSGCGGGGNGVNEDLAKNASNDGATLTPDQTRSLAQNDANRKKFDAMVAEVEPHLQRANNGTLELSTTRAVSLSQEAATFAGPLLAKTNELIKAGNIEVDDHLYIRVKNPDAVVADTRMENVNACNWCWWGLEWYLSGSGTSILADVLTSGQLAQAVKILKVYAAGTISASLGPFIATVAGILVAWGWTIKYVNGRGGGKGVRIKATWATLIIVEAQPFI